MTVFSQIRNYGLVGLANTAITATVIGILTLVGTGPLAANVAGYAAGLTNSFLLNGRFTFGARGSITPFVASFAIAYACNIGMLFATTSFAARPLVPQALGMLTHNAVFFVLMKFWVFNV